MRRAVQRLGQAEPDTISTSIVVACKLRFGATREGLDALTQRVEQLLSSVSILAFDEPATHKLCEFSRAPGLRVDDWLTPAARGVARPRMPDA